MINLASMPAGDYIVKPWNPGQAAPTAQLITVSNGALTAFTMVTKG